MICYTKHNTHKERTPMTPIQALMQKEGWVEESDGYWIDPEDEGLFAVEEEEELTALVWRLPGDPLEESDDEGDAEALYTQYTPEYYDEEWNYGDPPTGKPFPEWA